MCGRFVSARKRAELLEEFAVQRDKVAADREPDYNVAPTKRIYAVLDRKDKDKDKDKDGAERELRLLRWGLVPAWAKDTKGGARLINARSETVAVKPSFRAAFARRRCLIPADGYYEWQTEGKAKQPFYIYRTDGGILAFAGLYELWRNEEVPDDHEDAWYWSGTIITTDATDEVGKIHDRTPMVIAPDDWADWLDPANAEKEHLLTTMHPAVSSGSGGLAIRRVSTEVNSVRNNGATLIEAVLSPGGTAGRWLGSGFRPINTTRHRPANPAHDRVPAGLYRAHKYPRSWSKAARPIPTDTRSCSTGWVMPEMRSPGGDSASDGAGDELGAH